MIEAYPLYWPEGRARSRNRWPSKFKTTLGAARDGLMDELARLGARKIILSTNIPLRQDGLPYANTREPSDPGVAVYFEYKGKPMCFACDKYQYVRENLKGIEKTIDAMIRGIERWGSSDMMERAFRGFTALPEMASDSWRSVFGFSATETVNEEEIEARFRERAFKAHPDHGGTTQKFQQLMNARKDARRFLGLTS